MGHGDGMNYAPRAKRDPVCRPGEFRFSVIGLDHGHITGMTAGLVDAGGELVAVFDRDGEKARRFAAEFPGAKAVDHEEAALSDPSVQLIASAIVPNERGPLGLRVLDAGKHYFSDKAPFTDLAQLAAAREEVRRTGLKWAVCYSERVQNEAAVRAGELIGEGAIGRVLQVIGMGPHRLNAASRPDWFFQRERYGGILVDLGSHQIEQFLHFAGARSARVVHSKVGNLAHPEFPELDDFGDASLVADNGATAYFRVDWFTPDGLSTWGDGRTFVLGTDGYLELRKYVDVARKPEGDQIYLVDHRGEHNFPVHGTVGFPYFGALIRDILDGTDLAMPQEQTFLAAELCIVAQMQAERIVATT